MQATTTPIVVLHPNFIVAQLIKRPTANGDLQEIFNARVSAKISLNLNQINKKRPAKREKMFLLH